jgi:class 3 adenylate cyclase/tetratricopeptide (TPR) repeat protein
MGTETVAVLFTDLVGSTQLLSRVGEDRAEVLRREHFGILREAMNSCGGTEVKNLGDGLMIVFGAASGAVDAAVEMQQRIDLRNRTSQEPLGIRVALSMGECAVDAADYFGTPVVEAARLCAIAEGGQILTTDIVQALTRSRTDHPFAVLGPRDLKGLDTPVVVCEVQWDPIERLPTVSVPMPMRLARPPDSVFVGREHERATVLDALKDAESTDRRRIVLIAGEPGIGKTSLVTEVAAIAYEQGTRVLYGRCDEDIVVPYQPWREALAHLVAHAPTTVGEALARLDALLLETRTPRAGATADLESDRWALYGAVVEALTCASRDAPVVVILDDLHWTDAPSVALLRYVATSQADMRVLLIGTFRDAEIGPTHPLADTLAALHREAGVDRVRLDGLGDLEMLHLLERMAGHTMDDQGLALRDALVSETDGNPFFVGEILRHLAETGTILQQESGRWVAVTDLRERGLPVSVREVIGRRVARLGEDTRRALACASVIGRDFALPLLADVLDRNEDTVLDLIEPAIEAAIIAEVAPNHFTFTHALVEHALYDELSATRRARMHRLVAEALEASVGDNPRGAVTELAHHWSEATTPQDVTKAIDYAQLAGDFALEQLAPDESVRWYRRALELLDRDMTTDRHRRALLLVGLGDAQRQTGDPDFLATLVVAGNLARMEGDADLLVRAALATNTGFTHTTGTVVADIVALLEAAMVVTEGETSARRAKILAVLATELVYGDPDRARDLAGDAIQLAREVGDDATLVWVVVRAQLPCQTPDTLAERCELANVVVAAAERLDDIVLRWHVGATMSISLVEAGELDTAKGIFAMCEDVARKLGQPHMVWNTALERCSYQIIAGNATAAEASATEALNIGIASGQADALMFYGVQLHAIREMQGRTDEIIELFAEAVEDNPGLPALRAGLAHAYMAVGRSTDAARVLAPDIEDKFASFPFDVTWTLGMHVCAETVAELGLAEPATSLYERLAPFGHVLPCAGPTVYPVLADALGRLATTLEWFEAAEEHFAHAHAFHKRMPAPYYLARTDLAWAGMCLRRDATGDRARARSLVEHALDLARNGDFASVAHDGARLLQQLEAQ